MKHSADLKILKLQEKDWAQLKTIRLCALKEAPGAFGATFEAEHPMPDSFWKQRLTPSDQATFIASLNQQSVGLLVCAAAQELATAGLYAIWTAPEARQLRVGSALIKKAIEWAKQNSYKRLTLNVTDNNPAAISLYEKHGFQPTGHKNTLPPPRTHITEHERELHL